MELKHFWVERLVETAITFHDHKFHDREFVKKGEALRVLEPAAAEAVLARLAAIARTAPFDVKTTAAPHFRRVLLQQQVRRREILGIDDGIGRAPRGVNDGQGIAFVSHRGEIFPCGYLPVEAGNIRRQPFREIWEGSSVFADLRDPDLLGGKCGLCEFKRVCGGCRARAYGMTHEYLDEEPFCTYEPAALTRD